MSDTVVVHHEKKHRFELFLDGAMVGKAHYTLADGVASFDATQVSHEFKGRGLGGTLVRGAFEQVRAAGVWRIRPACPFVVRFVRKHPEYADLVVS